MNKNNIKAIYYIPRDCVDKLKVVSVAEDKSNSQLVAEILCKELDRRLPVAIDKLSKLKQV